MDDTNFTQDELIDLLVLPVDEEIKIRDIILKKNLILNESNRFDIDCSSCYFRRSDYCKCLIDVSNIDGSNIDGSHAPKYTYPCMDLDNMQNSYFSEDEIDRFIREIRLNLA